MTVSSSDAAALSSFEHRRDYADDAGRDRWTVRAVHASIHAALPPLPTAPAALVRLLDARSLSAGIAINSNCYLSNGVVLRAA
jgi:hypothetical protein